jgi:microcystin-dependent protein
MGATYASGTTRYSGQRATDPGNDIAGTALSRKAIGETGGEVNHTLTTNEMPAHKHNTNSTYERGLATLSTQIVNYNARTNVDYADSELNVSMPTELTMSNAGGGQAHNNQPPYYTLAFIMKVQ